MRRQFAAAGVGYRLDVGQVWRVDQHHVRTVGGERASTHWPGEDAREIEHAHAVQRLCGGRQGGQHARRGVANSFQRDEWGRNDHLAVRVRIPFVKVAHGSDHDIGVGAGLLEVERLPFCERGIDLRALRGRARGQAEHVQGAIAMVGKVGVHAHPAIAALVETGELVPHFGRVSVDRVVAGAFERGVRHVHRDALLHAIARLAERCGSQRGGGDARLRGAANGERGRQHRVRPGEVCLLQMGCVERSVGPNGAQHRAGVQQGSHSESP